MLGDNIMYAKVDVDMLVDAHCFACTTRRNTRESFLVLLIEDLFSSNLVCWCASFFQSSYQACYMLNFMPAVVLTSKVCPENMEATVYALLAGFQNFGQFVAV